ncbi:MAG: citryl-CoA lyase [Chloroflexi bacterium]|nr:citryl-CoA lyase [Chloroflexota bacterium]OJV89518.1 MAG: citryl-CoA lyase [Chloroflexi bacterium 54-19]
MEFPTGLGTSDATTIRLLGHNLAEELIGQVGFGELALWLATQKRPTPNQVRMFEAVQVSLADHGFTPIAIAARMTLYSAPDALQGALAAGLLGGGSRFLGVTEDTGRFLAGVLAKVDGPLPNISEEWDELARQAVKEQRAAGKFVPGLGHPVHKNVDPRTAVIFELAEKENLRGPHLRLFEAIGRVHGEILSRKLPLNGAGVAGAALADIGLAPELLRGVALLARAAGLLGHLAEEMRNPIAPAIYAAVDRNAVYRPLSETEDEEETNQ